MIEKGQNGGEMRHFVDKTLASQVPRYGDI